MYALLGRAKYQHVLVFGLQVEPSFRSVKSGDCWEDRLCIGIGSGTKGGACFVGLMKNLESICRRVGMQRVWFGGLPGCRSTCS